MRFRFSSGDYVPCLKDSELAEGQMKGLRVSGKPLLLVRQGRQVFAISNVCPHMGCSLNKGVLREYMVMCPCHGWKFDIRNGQLEGNDAIKLESYLCKTEKGEIYVKV